MTPTGYRQAHEKLERLKNVELPRLQKSLGEALQLGDITENSEVETARHEISLVERQIAELSDKLGRAEVIEPRESDAIALGAFVRVVDAETGHPDEFLLVGESETRPDVDTVSIASPLGLALLGKKVGDVADVEAPRGRIRYRVVSFRFSA